LNTSYTEQAGSKLVPCGGLPVPHRRPMRAGCSSTG